MILFLLISPQYNYAQKTTRQLSIYQLNIWQEGTIVKNGYEGIVNEVIHKNPDILILSEVRNYNGVDFVQKLLKSLKDKNLNYYGISNHEKLDVAIVSKYPITKQETLYPADKKIASVLKTYINIGEKSFLFYGVHLDYTNYACYLPRGYDGVTWKKLPHKITDNNFILEANRKSKRDEAITDIIRDIEHENKNQTIIIAGDFNEPSHLDWTKATKDLYDHNGTVIPWDCSVLLHKAGFTDTYRKKYPNPVTHPGFTFAAYNKDVELSKLVWAPDADDRDRIDYIYYKSGNKVSLSTIDIVGPTETIRYGQEFKNDSRDHFILPHSIWPTDHKGLFATFKW